MCTFQHGVPAGVDYTYHLCVHFSTEFLQVSGGIENPGTVPWYLGLSLLAAWLITYLFVCRGPSWFGKVSYITIC